MAVKSEQAIVKHILGAITEQRLKAGTKLGEQVLSDIFSCNRAIVRRALLTLSGHKVVELKPNRGAFVAIPSPEESRNVFQARRAVEATIIGNVIAQAGKRDIERLRDHLEKERAARAAGNRRDGIRLSGEFHRILGEISRNDVLNEFLSELVLRSSLIVGLYAPMSTSLCEIHDHRDITDAIEARDTPKAVELMEAHLRQLETMIRPDKDAEPADLHAILTNG